MKNSRQELILQIIEKYCITTQEELLRKLTDAGHSVTQATVSRDIRQMKLVKIMNDAGEYRYVSPESSSEYSEREDISIYSSALLESVKKVDCAMNIVVLKTYPGMASPVAAAVDSIKDVDILGCVAGDDTVIIIARSETVAIDISRKLSNLNTTGK